MIHYNRTIIKITTDRKAAKHMKLNGKSVVVTGASSGMGKAIVERFAKEGANIIAVARRKERLDELAESLKDNVGRVIPFVGDVSE
jgi:NADP-dependent 3-hydroxy acid dehydrogenase YdfG